MKCDKLLLRRLRMNSDRPQIRIFLPQRALDLLRLDVCLAQGDVRVNKGVQHEIELEVRAAGMV